MSFDAASLAARAASLRESGVVINRPRTNFKVTTQHIGKRNTVGTEEDHDRAWWIDYEQQNR